jgi:hypothetical protein
MYNMDRKREMKSFRISLRNAVKTVAVLAVIALSSNSAMAQTFNYTDASGVTCEYVVNGSGSDTYNDGNFPTITLQRIITMPSSVTKWVLPETVVNSNIGYRVWNVAGLNNSGDGGNLTLQLTEIAFPKFMKQINMNNSTVPFTNLKKVTFGEYARYCSTNLFNSSPLDTIIFKGVDIFVDGRDDGYVNAGFRDCFAFCPAATKIIIPCGTRALFELSMTNFPSTWNGRFNDPNAWTPANLVEAECLNTLTVLSSDNALGNAYSFAGCGFVTTTPSNTSANHSGNITLLALAKGGNVFLGWNDGNLDNPRVVNVTADVTYTAQFATCTNTAIKSVSAQASGISVYPNPVENLLTVVLDRDVREGTLALFDLNGKLAARQEMNGRQAVINTQSLGKGLYILRLVEGGSASEGVKIVKQ